MKIKKLSNKAFTLIEILVVVLIIGVLAAIAVPQYQKSVAKAELGQIISLTRSVKEAEELFYLASNRYAQIEDLDIAVKDSKATCQLLTQDYFRCYNKNFAILYYFRNAVSGPPTWTECFINSTDYNSALAFACNDFLNNQSLPRENNEGTLRNCGTLFNPAGSQCRSFAGYANF